MYRFPEGLYADIRIERTETASYNVQNGEVKQNSEYRPFRDKMKRSVFFGQSCTTLVAILFLNVSSCSTNSSVG